MYDMSDDYVTENPLTLIISFLEEVTNLDRFIDVNHAKNNFVRCHIEVARVTFRTSNHRDKQVISVTAIRLDC